MSQSARLAAAAALRSARRGSKIAELPPEIAPTSMEEAYQIQDLVLGDEAVAGWKVGATAAPGTWTCAPMPASSRLADGAVFEPGNHRLEVEVEIAIRIAADLPPGSVYSRSDVLAAVGGAHAAFEIIESRFVDRKKVAPLSTLADAQSSLAFAIGSGVEDWQDIDLTALDVVLSADGQELARTRGGANVVQTIDALTWLANHASGRGRGLKAGQFVITGARIGPVIVPSAQRIVAEVPPLGLAVLHLNQGEGSGLHRSG